VRPAAEALATQMVLKRTPVILRREAEDLVKKFDPSAPATIPLEASEGPVTARQRKKSTLPPTSLMLTSLLESGLLVAFPGGRIAFSHLAWLTFLAGAGLARSAQEGGGLALELVSTPDWPGRTQTLHYLAAHDTAGLWVSTAVGEPGFNPLYRSLLQAGRWLYAAPAGATWTGSILRLLASLLNQEGYAVGLRARSMIALAMSGSPGVSSLFKQALGHKDPIIRQLAALGAGYLRDNRLVPDLVQLLKDPGPRVRQAACLGLVGTGDKHALEAIGGALLHGDEALRRYAAEALANHPEEGHPTLQDGSTVEDILVRRSIIYGLLRLRRQPWALDLLNRMQTSDAQWVIQNAANEALQAAHLPDGRIPHRLPDLSNAGWLITYAGSKGMGIVPGKPTDDLVLGCLRDGGEELKLAALEYLMRSASEKALLGIYHVYYGGSSELREAALTTLWHLSAAGVPLPPPVQFGFN
jgi:hypothetical protein